MSKKLLLILVLAFLLVATLAGCRGATLTTLSVVEGNVLIMKQGADTWVEAQAGMNLEPGDTIKAGDNSRATITFFEGSTIELEPGTEVNVAELSVAATGSTTIRLKQDLGKTVSRVEKLTDPASRYEVETPAAVALVRGTRMGVTVFADGFTWVDNWEGSVVAQIGGKEYPVSVGYRLPVRPGELPGALILITSQVQPSPTPSPIPREELPPTLPVKPYKPAIAITKEANSTKVHEGDKVTYTYEVTNTGNTPLSDVSVDDDKAGDATYQSGDANGNNKLDADETWIFTATYTVSDEDDNPLVNTATASGTGVLTPEMAAASPRKVTAQASASVSILRPAIAITKEADPTEAQQGDEITYTYEVDNAGNTPLSNVSVDDDKAGDVTYQNGDTNNNDKLDVNETWIFTATYTVTEGDDNPLVNEATASGTDALGETVTDQASASVAILIYGIRIELTWDAETDLDSHFIRPGGEMWDMLDDCHWRNENPDWGLPGVVEDNPVLSGDIRGGYGPENIHLKQPYEEGVYQYKVHCWDDYGYGPSTATVIIWINNVQVAEYSKELSYDEVWDCASIEWPSGVVTPASGGESYLTPPEVAK
jgi:uncharacterized repeat protein (TIGR01451 family)